MVFSWQSAASASSAWVSFFSTIAVRMICTAATRSLLLGVSFMRRPTPWIATFCNILDFAAAPRLLRNRVNEGPPAMKKAGRLRGPPLQLERATDVSRGRAPRS